MTYFDLSNLLRVGVSTYTDWPLDSTDIYECMRQDLDECWIENFFDTWDIDEWLDFEWFKKDLWEYLQRELESEVDLKTLFEKYDIEYDWMRFYTPQYYNYENDSLDIKLDFKLENDEWLAKHFDWLKELVKEYIEKIRVESYDWYTSFEPSKLDDVKASDYCVIWAILKKEWVFDKLKVALQNCVDKWVSSIYRQNSNPVYLLKDSDWNWVEHKLDMEKKTFIPYSKDKND